jgi:hypothetical protein
MVEKEVCEFCKKAFEDVDAHIALCRGGKKFFDKLEDELFLQHEEHIWVSGAGKVLLLLRGETPNEQYLKANPHDRPHIQKLMAFEKEHNFRLEYDHKKNTVYALLEVKTRQKKR